MICFTNHAQATAPTFVYNIAAKIFIDGTLLATPHLVLRPAEKGEVSFKTDDAELKIHVLAREAAINRDAIKVSFDVDYQDHDHLRHYNANLILSPNEEATVKLFSPKNHSFELKVIINRE